MAISAYIKLTLEVPVVQATTPDPDPLNSITDPLGYVTSWNTRTGDVVPATGDYTAGQVTNNSSVTGNYVSDALNWLLANTQQANSTLDGIAALAPVTTSQMLYTTGTDVFAVSTITAFGRSLLDDADAATARATLGVTATGADTTYAYRANNLSDMANAATALDNIGGIKGRANLTTQYRAMFVNAASEATESTTITTNALGALNTTVDYVGISQNVHQNTSAAAASVVGATYTVMNDNGYYGLMGMTGSGSTLAAGAYANTFHIYNEGYAASMYTVDGNRPHIWYTDPDDTHTFTFIEKMRLTAAGTLQLVAGGDFTIVGGNSLSASVQGASNLTTQYRMAYVSAAGTLTESSSIVTDASGTLLVGSGASQQASEKLGVNGDVYVNGGVTTTSDATINTITVGLGNNNIATNTACGLDALMSVTSGIQNTGIGNSSLFSLTEGDGNNAFGGTALYSCTSGDNNTGFGREALRQMVTGSNNVGIGYRAGRYYGTGTASNTTPNTSIFIGNLSRAEADSQSNQIVIGYNALGAGSNSVVIGNDSITTTLLKGNVLIGTTSQYASEKLGVNGDVYVNGDLTINDELIISNGSIIQYTGAGNVRFVRGAFSDMTLFDASSSGETRELSISGYRAGDALRTLAIGVGVDAADTASFDGVSNYYFDGNLLIGTTSQYASEKLGVNGSIWANTGGHFGGATDYSTFETDGTLVFSGAATVWEDANISGATLGGNASVRPDIVEILATGGASTNIYTLGFDTGEKASGAIEIPHAYKEGSDITFHIHWSGNTAPSGTDNVQWQLEYCVVGSDALIPAVTTIVIETGYDTAYERVNSAFVTIDGSTFGMGDQFLFTISRIAASADEYAGDALLHTTGIHYEKDTVGSRQITTK